MRVSLVILSRNEERYIGDTLRKVFAQRAADTPEVILIDSGSRDATLRIARGFPVKICSIPPAEFGHGRTRMRGALMTHGEAIVFLNADATPLNEFWLQRLVENIEAAGVAGAFSRAVPREDCNPLRAWELLRESSGARQVRVIDDRSAYDRMDPRRKRSFLAFQSVSCAIRRDVLLRHPFRDVEFGEDLEWSKRVLEQGYTIVFEPDSAVIHSHNFYNSFPETFRKYYDDSRLNKQLLNFWSRDDLALLPAHIAYKIARDLSYVSGSRRSMPFKLSWCARSPFIRAAEFLGILAGINSGRLPQRLHAAFSLAHARCRGEG